MGKLVQQDTNDEPASELLNRIAAEKTRLINEKKLKKTKAPSPIDTAEEPFSLPLGWSWSYLGQTGIGATGKTPKTSNSANFGGDIEFIGPGQISPTGELSKPDKYLTEKGIKGSTEALRGDILMVCIGGSIGKSVVSEQRIAFNQQINAISPIHISSEFLNSAVSTDFFYRSVLEKSTGSATPIINRSKWENLLVPIPPLAEQHRIVAKVDELMALCDTLKSTINSANAIQLNLTDTISNNYFKVIHD